MRPMPVFAALAIPLVFTIAQLFPWLGAKHGEAPNPDTSAESSPIAEARGLAAREPAAMRDLPVANVKRMETRRGARGRADHRRTSART